MADGNELRLETDEPSLAFEFTPDIKSGDREENITLCFNPVYIEKLRNVQESGRLEAENDAKLKSTFDYEVGGDLCDAEDRGAVTEASSSRKCVPQLVFLDSDDSSSTEQLYKDKACEQVFPTSEKKNSQTFLRKNNPESNGLSLMGIHKEDFLTSSQKSVSSNHSSDSDLITDHSVEQTMSRNDDTIQLNSVTEHVREQSSGLFSIRKDWHCHDHSLKLPPDKTARNQLLAVSILCFLFMVGETVGKSIHCSRIQH